MLPRGAATTGLKSNTLSNGPYLFAWTWKPAACRIWVACSTESPITYGTLTTCGPVDTLTTTVSPGRTSVLAAGCLAGDGALRLLTGVVRLLLQGHVVLIAHCWAAS